MILQPNKEAYHQELLALQQERLAKNQEENNSSEKDQLSRDWVLDNFCFRDNPIIKENLEVGEELIHSSRGKDECLKNEFYRIRS